MSLFGNLPITIGKQARVNHLTPPTSNLTQTDPLMKDTADIDSFPNFLTLTFVGLVGLDEDQLHTSESVENLVR